MEKVAAVRYARQKAQRDQISFQKAAEMRGEARGRAEGEARGRAEGEIARIHLCQRLLKRTETPHEQLLALSAEERQRLARDFEREIAPN